VGGGDGEEEWGEVEEKLIQRKLTGQGQDGTRWPAKLVSKLAYLASGVASSDFPPTAQHREVHVQFKQQIKNYQQQLNELVNRDLEAFNSLLRERRVQNIITRTP